MPYPNFTAEELAGFAAQAQQYQTYTAPVPAPTMLTQTAPVQQQYSMPTAEQIAAIQAQYASVPVQAPTPIVPQYSGMLTLPPEAQQAYDNYLAQQAPVQQTVQAPAPVPAPVPVQQPIQAPAPGLLTNSFDAYELEGVDSASKFQIEQGLDNRPDLTGTAIEDSYLPNRPVGEDVTETDMLEWSNYYKDNPDLKNGISVDEQSDLLYWDWLNGDLTKKELFQAGKELRLANGLDERHISIDGRDNHRFEWRASKGRKTGGTPTELFQKNHAKVGGYFDKEKLPGGSFFQDEVLANPIVRTGAAIATSGASELAIAAGKALNGETLHGADYAGAVTGAVGLGGGLAKMGIPGVSTFAATNPYLTAGLQQGALTGITGGDIDDILKSVAAGSATANVAGLAEIAGLDKFSNLLANDNAAGTFTSSLTSDILNQAIQTGSVDLGDALETSAINTGIDVVGNIIQQAESTRDPQKMFEEGALLNGEEISAEDAAMLADTSSGYALFGPDSIVSNIFDIETSYIPTDLLGSAMDWVLGKDSRDMAISPDGSKYPVIDGDIYLDNGVVVSANGLGKGDYADWEATVEPSRFGANDVLAMIGEGVSDFKEHLSNTGYDGIEVTTDIFGQDPEVAGNVSNDYDERFFDPFADRSFNSSLEDMGIYEENPFGVNHTGTELTLAEENVAALEGLDIRTGEAQLPAGSSYAGEIEEYTANVETSEQDASADDEVVGVVTDPIVVEDVITDDEVVGTRTARSEVDETEPELPGTQSQTTTTTATDDTSYRDETEEELPGGGDDTLPSRGLLGGGGGAGDFNAYMKKLDWKRPDVVQNILLPRNNALDEIAMLTNRLIT